MKWLACAVSMSFVLVAAPAAPASELNGFAYKDSPLRITYSAGPGETNNLSVTFDDEGALVEDTGVATIGGREGAPSPLGCTRAGADNRWRCPYFSSEPWTHEGDVHVELGDGHDRVVVGTDNPGIKTNGRLIGGTGDDHLSHVTPYEHPAHFWFDPGVNFDGGEGSDTFTGRGVVDYSARTSPVTVVFGGGPGGGEPGGIDGTAGDTLSADLTGVLGGSGSDTLDASAAGAKPLYITGGAGNDTITGGEGNDEIFAGGGADTIDGRGGDDELDGEGWEQGTIHGDDTLSGGEGNDILTGRGGNDALDGGAGDDQLAPQGGADDIHGGPGRDTALMGWGYPSDFGGPGYPDNPTSAEDRALDLDDVADDGGAGDNHADNFHSDLEEIWGGGGNDVISGTDAPERFDGADGNDRIDGRGGDDRINDSGRTSDDELLGGEGNDRVDGGAGSDRIDGGGGNDLVEGGRGTFSDTLIGGAGNDRLYGFRPAYPGQAFGLWDQDTAPYTDATDSIDAGVGDDLIVASDNQAETFDCGGGDDITFADQGDTAGACETVDHGPPPIRVQHYRGPGNTLSTLDDAQGVDPNAPFRTTITLASFGDVAIEQSRRVLNPHPPADLIPFEATTTVAPATVTQPHELTFMVRADAVPDGKQLKPRHDGTDVPGCAATNSQAAPDPCVSWNGVEPSRWHRVIVLTTRAGVWHFAVTPTVPDTSAPRVKVTSLGRPTLKSTVKSGLAVPLRASEKVRASVGVTLDRKTAKKLGLPRSIGNVRGRVTGSGKLKVKLTRRAAKKLKRHRGSLVVTVTARAADAAGNKSRAASRKLRLR